MSTDDLLPGHTQDKDVSSPFPTGSGGARFEVQVMSAFAALMLARRFAPCVSAYLPIRSIRLQARQAGYRIDDFVVLVSNAENTDQRKLLAQVKHGISFTKSDSGFRETIAAAWNDHRDPAIFTPNKDAIAIIAGPLSATDVEDTRRILEWARTSVSPHEFFEKVNTATFSSKAKRDKLDAFLHQVNAAAGEEVNHDDVFTFLRHVHVLGFDLDVGSGIMHALLHGIIGHNTDNPPGIWARIAEVVGNYNQNAGTLTVDCFPDDVQAAFMPRPVEVMPTSIALTVPPKSSTDWNASEFATALAVANLIGAWDERSEADQSIVAMLTPDRPDEWLRKMRELLQFPESPLTHVNGTWTVRDRLELWSRLASRIFAQTLSDFQECAKMVLAERDPRFELEPEQRFAAQIHGKVTKHSWALRKGIAETIALLGTNAARLPNCAPPNGDTAALVVVRETLEDADWPLWASLDRLLPILAEAAPNAFLDAVERALQQRPCPFDVIFAQERGPFSGGNYISGLLWALEALAWDEALLVRASVTLAMLAARDPGGQWANRPANSLTTIFLPWFPQTRASIEKRRVAVRTIVNERPQVGWQLLMSLLPQHQSASSGTHKPKWRIKLDSDKAPRPTNGEYWEQISLYAQIAVEFVHTDAGKLTELINSLDSLPEPSLNSVLDFAESETVVSLTDEHRLPIWSALSSFVRKHRKYADAKWALPAKIVDKIDAVAAKLAPNDPTVKHRTLFVNNTWDLYDDEDWQKSRELLAQRQVDAVREILDAQGIEGVKSFAAQVENAVQVGYALGKLGKAQIINELIPELVLAAEPKHRQLVRGFVSACWERGQWEWFDSLDLNAWSEGQVAHVLIELPFDADTWRRAGLLLGDDAKEYWTRVPVHRFQTSDAEYRAVDALLRHGRPRAAVTLLATCVLGEQSLDADRTISALLGAVNSQEASASIDEYSTEIVIQALQKDSAVDKDRLRSVEWAYLPLLERSHRTAAKALNAAVATTPQFFCDIIRQVFRSDHDTKSGEMPEPTQKERAIAENAYRFLMEWDTVPGSTLTGDISAQELTCWINEVADALAKSGHLEIGLHKAGEVFIHAPADADGLFVHRAVADVLNREDMGELRRGYEMALYNSRGVHGVDPTGAQEKQLEDTFRKKADTVENAGYHRLAVTLRSIADTYLREAERIIAEHAGDEPEAEM